MSLLELRIRSGQRTRESQHRPHGLDEALKQRHELVLPLTGRLNYAERSNLVPAAYESVSPDSGRSDRSSLERCRAAVGEAYRAARRGVYDQGLGANDPDLTPLQQRLLENLAEAELDLHLVRTKSWTWA